MLLLQLILQRIIQKRYDPCSYIASFIFFFEMINEQLVKFIHPIMSFFIKKACPKSSDIKNVVSL